MIVKRHKISQEKLLYSFAAGYLFNTASVSDRQEVSLLIKLLEMYHDVTINIEQTVKNLFLTEQCARSRFLVLLGHGLRFLKSNQAFADCGFTAPVSS